MCRGSRTRPWPVSPSGATGGSQAGVVVPQVGLEPTTHERDLGVGLPNSRRAQRVTILVTDSRCRHHARQAGQPRPTYSAPGS